MRFQAIGIVGGEIATPRARASIRSSAGSTSGECAASDTNNRWPITLRRAKASSTVSTAPVSPEITTLSGPLMAAIATRSRSGTIAASTSSTGANSAAIIPPGGKLSISRPRSAMSRNPSSSENTPAAQAAAYSPTECPMTPAGVIPHDPQSVVRAYSIANIAGWVQPISWIGGSRSEVAEMT